MTQKIQVSRPVCCATAAERDFGLLKALNEARAITSTRTRPIPAIFN